MMKTKQMLLAVVVGLVFANLGLCKSLAPSRPAELPTRSQRPLPTR